MKLFLPLLAVLLSGAALIADAASEAASARASQPVQSAQR